MTVIYIRFSPFHAKYGYFPLFLVMIAHPAPLVAKRSGLWQAAAQASSVSSAARLTRTLELGA
jgi:hypothetical protein